MIIEKGNSDNVKAVVKGLNDFNLAKEPAQGPTWQPIEWIAKAENGQLMGGILGGVGFWMGLEIYILWVEEAYREKGIGKALLQKMEKEAAELGATISMLDTFDFQAEGFYRKMGYTEFGRIRDFPKGRNRIYLSKAL